MIPHDLSRYLAVLLQVDEVDIHLVLPCMMVLVCDGLYTFTTNSSNVLGCLISQIKNLPVIFMCNSSRFDMKVGIVCKSN
jgi:hypothetical protein